MRSGGVSTDRAVPREPPPAPPVSGAEAGRAVGVAGAAASAVTHERNARDRRGCMCECSEGRTTQGRHEAASKARQAALHSPKAVEADLSGDSAVEKDGSATASFLRVASHTHTDKVTIRGHDRGRGGANQGGRVSTHREDPTAGRASGSCRLPSCCSSEAALVVVAVVVGAAAEEAAAVVAATAAEEAASAPSVWSGA